MLRPAQEMATNLDGPARDDLLAEGGVPCQDEQRAFKIEADCAGSRSAVLGPPLGQAFELADRASLDDIRERHRYP